MKDPLKPRDKITQKMSRDGLIEVNETKETAERISRREQETDFSKQPEQAAQDTAAQLTSPGTFPKNDTGKTERVMEHIGAAQTRQASKNAVRRAQEEAAANVKTSRLQFTAEELSNPELEAYIRKSQKAADNLDAARAALPKEKVLVKERVFEEATGKGKTRLHFEEREKPMPNGKHHKTRSPVRRRKRGYSSITKYMKWRKTIPAWRAHIRPRKSPSAAQSMGQGKSVRATTGIN